MNSFLFPGSHNLPGIRYIYWVTVGGDFSSFVTSVLRYVRKCVRLIDCLYCLFFRGQVELNFPVVSCNLNTHDDLILATKFWKSPRDKIENFTFSINLFNFYCTCSSLHFILFVQRNYSDWLHRFCWRRRKKNTSRIRQRI